MTLSCVWFSRSFSPCLIWPPQVIAILVTLIIILVIKMKEKFDENTDTLSRNMLVNVIDVSKMT